MSQKIEQITGRGIPLVLDDIDTDRIIPARYLRCVTFDGLGAHAFEDDRKQDRSHPFDDCRFQGAKILVAGRNFGCGSSREHAPQALMRWGIQAVVAESFAEIFFGNCTSLGIPCVQAERSVLDTLGTLIGEAPETNVTVDLVAKEVRAGEIVAPVEILEGARSALVTGDWDFLSQLLEAGPAVEAKAQSLPYLTGFAAR